MFCRGWLNCRTCLILLTTNVPNGGKKYFVTLATVGEVLLGVINDSICGDGPDDVYLPRTAHAGHICLLLRGR